MQPKFSTKWVHRDEKTHAHMYIPEQKWRCTHLSLALPRHSPSSYPTMYGPPKWHGTMRQSSILGSSPTHGRCVTRWKSRRGACGCGKLGGRPSENARMVSAWTTARMPPASLYLSFSSLFSSSSCTTNFSFSTISRDTAWGTDGMGYLRSSNCRGNPLVLPPRAGCLRTCMH